MLNKSVSQYSLDQRNSIPTSKAGMSQSRMTIIPWRWYSTSPSAPHQPHLQHMLLWMQKYDFIIEYKPGKDMIHVDYLSYSPSNKDNLPIELHHSIQHIHFSSDRLNTVWGTVERNLIHSDLYTTSSPMDGLNASTRLWRSPDTSGVPRISYPLRMESDWKLIALTSPLSYSTGPWLIYTEVTKEQTKCSLFAWATVYWPSIIVNIADYVRRSTLWTKHKTIKLVQPVLPKTLPKINWLLCTWSKRVFA